MGWGADFWDPVNAELGGTAVTPTLPGYLPNEGRFTLDAGLAAVREAVAAAGEPVVLAGVSLGARLAARFAAQSPELVSRLVLSGIALSTNGLSAGIQRLVYRMAPASFVTAMSPRNTRQGTLDTLAALPGLETESDLERVSAPTLVVCGSKDRDFLPHARRAADLVPGAKFVEIAEGDHFWAHSQPAEFVALLRPDGD